MKEAQWLEVILLNTNKTLLKYARTLFFFPCPSPLYPETGIPCKESNSFLYGHCRKIPNALHEISFRTALPFAGSAEVPWTIHSDLSSMTLLGLTIPQKGSENSYHDKCSVIL